VQLLSTIAPSSQHWYVEPGTVDVQLNVALELSTTSSGPVRIVTSGGRTRSQV
jgi:hypothetical protein